LENARKNFEIKKVTLKYEELYIQIMEDRIANKPQKK
jgi:hypothetical protein